MSQTGISMGQEKFDAGVARIDMKLEVAIIPVSDVERATQFYTKKLGWRQDVTPPGSGVVQLTPHGSSCSIQFGKTLTSATPGSARSYLVVSDIQATREALIKAGVEVGEIFHLGAEGIAPGPDPEHRTYRSRAVFSDPDGNSWILQEITSRLPGRVDTGVTSFGSATDLATALRRAEAAHGEHEKRTGQADPNWPDWYAAYMAAEQAGTELPA
ncbi:MAG TPA: VOC family protein [Candidatus Limnocylindrales bacterium]|nr:VOC family protein [Candidatus Limnocylindrales bacterium]